MVLTNHIKKLILNHINNNDIQLTYLSIGSAMNKDQQLPNFISNYGLNTRIIIIDPCLEDQLSFIVESGLEFNTYWIDTIKIYKNDKYEFLCIKEAFDPIQDFLFLKKITDTILNQNGLLLGYNFSGYNMFNLQQQLFDNYYDNTETRQKFLSNILLDITYGHFELSCFPNLDNIYNQPNIVFENGKYKIINICCYHLDKNIEIIIDTIITSKINLSNQIKVYLKNVMYKFNNEIYVKYRQLRENIDNIKQYHDLINYIKNTYKNMAILLGIDFDSEAFLISIQNNDKYSCFDDINKLIMTKISNEIF